MGDILTTDMDVDVDFSTTALPSSAESGVSDTMSIFTGGLTYDETNKLIRSGINPFGYFASVKPPHQICADPTYHFMDVDVDFSTTALPSSAESGVSDTMDKVNILNRPLRRYLSTLIQAGFVHDYTEAKFSEIPQIVTSNMDVEMNLPCGASGAWGALQRYDGDALESTIQWSFDQFKTALKSETITNVEYISGSGIPEYVVKGDNDPNAGDTGRDKQDFKVLPVMGYEQTDLNLDDMGYWKPGPPYYGWNEINYQFGRLRVSVTDCFGTPIAGAYVTIKRAGYPDRVYLTDSLGVATIDMAAASVDVISLRGSKTKHGEIKPLQETSLAFAFAGFHITAIGPGNIPLVGNLVIVKEIGGDEEEFRKYTDVDGIVQFPDIKINTPYKITVANYHRDQASGGEGLPIYLTFEPSLTGWEPPPGYPSERGFIVIYVKDKLTKKHVEGLKMHVTDGTLEFYGETGKEGATGFIIPALTDFVFEVLTGADRRYLPFKEDINLEDNETSTFIKELPRRITRGQY